MEYPFSQFGVGLNQDPEDGCEWVEWNTELTLQLLEGDRASLSSSMGLPCGRSWCTQPKFCETALTFSDIKIPVFIYDINLLSRYSLWMSLMKPIKHAVCVFQVLPCSNTSLTKDVLQTVLVLCTEPCCHSAVYDSQLNRPIASLPQPC